MIFWKLSNPNIEFWVGVFGKPFLVKHYATFPGKASELHICLFFSLISWKKGSKETCNSSEISQCPILWMNVSKPASMWNYLLQIFSKPIFEEDTFFLEVIQRLGSRGFGSGNIKALAMSIALEKNKNREEKQK